jgi:signal transduction histidine kinase
MEAGAWQVVLTHRLGSVDAAVTQARQRNLAVSLGILFILAVSVGIILVSAQRERRLARQQMEFVSAVSHELRTPLAVICSAGENLADGVVSDADQTRRYGTLVRNEGRRLADMVEQVLDFAGMQSGQRKYKLEPVDVSDVIDDALSTFEMQLRDSDIVVEKRVAIELPQVLADRPALVRGIQNLIGNALKYGQAGNWLSVRSEAGGEHVKIIVEDRGAGISPFDLPHIFEPFYRGRSVVDAQIKGSGLGLSLVKQIVEAHNGTITVESASGRGTTFTIILPVVDAMPNLVSSHDQAYSPR